MRANNQNAKTLVPAANREILGEDSLSAAELAQVWAKRAYQLAQAPPTPLTGQTLDLLVFWLGRERYGLEVSNVREIFPVQQLTPDMLYQAGSWPTKAGLRA